MRLIDADALNIYDISPVDGFVVMGVTEEDIDLAPTIDAVSEWIPCSERLPSDGQYVIIQYYDTVWKNHVSVVGACYNNLEGFVDTGYGEAWFGDGNDDVLAWMPLPEPWKGADDETR